MLTHDEYYSTSPARVKANRVQIPLIVLSPTPHRHLGEQLQPCQPAEHGKPVSTAVRDPDVPRRAFYGDHPMVPDLGTDQHRLFAPQMPPDHLLCHSVRGKRRMRKTKAQLRGSA